MAAGHLEKLFFTIELIDKASGGTSKIINQIDKVQKHAQKGMAMLAVGAAGLFGVSYALDRMTGPAQAMANAVRRVSSLGVDDNALKILERDALSFALHYGESASDIVRSSYDIQSAMAGLQGNELARLTTTSALLAKATTADSATITDYMGTMYGIFKETAEKAGKLNWAENLSAQTALAVKMFKTDGNKMAAAFSGLGKDATSAGFGLSEQLAILGKLQSTMGGGESATKYRAFLAGAGKAQKQLGLQFTDSEGRLLPMLDVLTKLRGKFGDVLDLAEGDALTKAFGSGEATALIKLLIGDTKGLAESIGALGRVKGLDNVREMAEKQIDPMARWKAGINAVAIAFGKTLQPALDPLANSLGDGAAKIVRWTEHFPNVTRVVGTLALGVIALVGVISLLAIVGGVAQLSMAGYHSVLLIGERISKGYTFAKGVMATTMGLVRAAALAGAITFGMLNTSLSLGTAATWLFNAALMANPITWIVLGVVALVAALVGLVVYWDVVKAAALGMIDGVVAGFNALKGWLANLNPFNVLGPGLDWLIDKINMIPRISIGADVDAEKASINRAAGLGSDGDQVARGGDLMNQITNATSNNNGVTVEKMEIKTTGGVNGFQLADELALAGG